MNTCFTSLEEAIHEMLDHFSEYKKNAERFYQTFDPDAGNRELKEEISRRLMRGAEKPRDEQ